MKHIGVIIHNNYKCMPKIRLSLDVVFLGEAKPFANLETGEITYRGYFQMLKDDEGHFDQPISVKSTVPFTGMKWGEEYRISAIQSANKFGVFYSADLGGLLPETEEQE